MQLPHNKLNEVLYEITSSCHNGCDYCGSKEERNKDIDTTNIKAIVNSIAEYLKDGEINITGGDPLLLPIDIHKYVVDTLQSRNNKVKILINLKSYKNSIKNTSLFNDILSLYDLIGVSVNDKEEIFMLSKLPLSKDKHTIITNFNLNNIWEYDSIETIVKNNDLTWQVQYTMYKEEGKASLYDNPIAKEHLFNKLNASFKNKVKILLADNINSGKCSAGRHSCGITFDGYITPCLSFRSWNKDMDYQGNILTSSLQTIWETKFQSYRFCDFTCCKDICNSPFKIEVQTMLDLFKPSNPLPKDMPDYPNFPYHPFPAPHVVLYGVTTYPENIMVYGVKQTTMYTSNAVTTDYTQTED